LLGATGIKGSWDHDGGPPRSLFALSIAHKIRHIAIDDDIVDELVSAGPSQDCHSPTTPVRRHASLFQWWCSSVVVAATACRSGGC
jgi:hypothetical protein